MSKDLMVSLSEIVGSPFCVSTIDGQKVYELLSIALQKNQTVALSFNMVTALTAAFLNIAIGQLYGKFPEEEIKIFLFIQEIDRDDQELLKCVIENAKLYFKDPEKYNQEVRDDDDGV